MFTASDGVRLVADVAGPQDAPVIILSHGGGQTRHSWSRAFQRLAEAGYRVINFDSRGHGQSDWSTDNRYPVERRWADMKEIIDDAVAPSTPVAIVGASMGGGTALFGTSQGFRPNALILVDITPNSERAGMTRVRDFMASGLCGFATLEDAATAVAAYNTERPRPKDVSGLKRNLRQRDDGRWYWHWDPGMVEVDIDHERAVMAKTMDGLYAARNVPILLVRGIKSDVVTDRTVAEFQARIPHLSMVDVSGAGHMVAGDRNDHFNDATISFLAKHMPPE